VRIGDLFDSLDPIWVEHGDRVGKLATLIGDAFEMSERSLSHLELAARLHDVGKAHIDQSVLAKPGALTPQEWAIVRAHPGVGFDVIKGAVDPEIAQMVLYHHERYDGFGYPHGLAGSRIPLGARVLATIDAFDAMVTERPYSASIPAEAALEELARCAGSQFDPDVVEIVGWVLAGEFLPDHATEARAVG
jgi:HD-GYP domain-containing protein (c-di-GMP phosphodiesterase class II)